MADDVRGVDRSAGSSPLPMDPLTPVVPESKNGTRNSGEEG
jgi:hypothetical protein